MHCARISNIEKCSNKTYILPILYHQLRVSLAASASKYLGVAQRNEERTSRCADINEDSTNNVESDIGRVLSQKLNRIPRLRLILPDLTAIRVGLSHASRTLFNHVNGVADGSVTRSKPTLKAWITPGNWD